MSLIKEIEMNLNKLEAEKPREDCLEKTELTEERMQELIEIYRKVVWESLQTDEPSPASKDIFYHPV